MTIVCDPYWITPSLAIVPRPAGGGLLLQEMAAMRAAGTDVVVSMLEPAEALELGLEREEEAARKSGIRFVSFPIPDHGTPTETEPFEKVLEFLERSIREEKRVGVHCRGCIGRSSLLVASLLVRSGMKDVDAWRQIREARGTSVPETPQQRAWVENEIRPKAWHRI